MKNILKISFLKILVFIFLISCSKEADPNDLISPFYKNALKGVTITDIEGIWSIYTINYEDQIAQVPQNYSECSRDFFIFSASGNYSEYLFQDSDCNFLNNNFSFTLLEGIISLSDGLNSEELVVTSITSNELKFKAKYDINEDGLLDIMTITAKRYQPSETDLYTKTFRHAYENPNSIRLTWSKYNGFADFEKYEIYRTNNCNKSDAKLISTITDANTSYFIDETPEPSKYICYYLKLYTNKGLLGESYLVEISTENIELAQVTLEKPIENQDSVTLNWSKFSGYYFSHYEIWIGNYKPGVVGSSEQNQLIATINDINKTSFIDINPALFNNPTYYVIVHDIFGNKNFLNSSTGKQTTFKNKKIITIQNIKLYAVDQTATNVYLLGTTEDYQEAKIIKYNYSSNSIVATSAKTGIANSQNIKLETSKNNDELFIGNSFNEISIFKTENLDYKYNLTFDEINNIYDFLELENNIWVLIDREYLYTFKRDFRTVTFISKEKHFSTTKYNYRYHLIKTDNNAVIVGHFDEPTSFKFSIDSYGIIKNKSTLNIPIKSKDNIETYYNLNQNSIINTSENKVYSVTNQALISSYESPYYTYNLNRLGNTVYGTNNDSEWSIDYNSLHKKEVFKTTISNRTTTKINTKGYSHFIFENYKGEIISISSGLKRSNLYYNAPNSVEDIFIEKLE